MNLCDTVASEKQRQVVREDARMTELSCKKATTDLALFAQFIDLPHRRLYDCCNQEGTKRAVQFATFTIRVPQMRVWQDKWPIW